MAHNLQSRDIQTGIQQAWHGLTNIVESITRENSGIDYDMDIVPLYIMAPDGSTLETPHRQIISLDDNLPIGKPVSDSYCLISNSRIWDMVNSALGGMKHEIVSVGTVDDRSKGFLTVKLDDAFQAASRNTEPYFNLLWGHGGNLALYARSGFVVTVCQNTFNANLGRKGKDLNLSIKHSRNALDRIEGMEKAIESHYGVVAEFKNAMDSFEAISCDEEKATKIFSGFLTPDLFEKTEKVATRTINTVNRLVQLFNGGAGNRGKNLADVFNSATDYYTHESSGKIGENNEKQFVSSEFGSGNRMKGEIYNILNDSESLAKVIQRGEKVMLAMN
jgi:hypothetical protein